MPIKDSMTLAREARDRRISQIEEALARPAFDGAAWDQQRSRLQRELDRLLAVRKRQLNG